MLESQMYEGTHWESDSLVMVYKHVDQYINENSS